MLPRPLSFPLRPAPPGRVSNTLWPLTHRSWRPFSHHHDADLIHGKTHYEVLGIPPQASPGEVKKAFYRLSKKHHPDHNPSDPQAAHRFTRISEAYTVLGTPAKRASYDQAIGTHSHTQHTSGHAHPRRGSYHGAGPAGGRPASGLSRRRARFHSPSPSFTRNPGHRGTGEHGSGHAGGSAYKHDSHGGMGPGQDPFVREPRPGEIPYFDKEGHERTHRKGDEIREQRQRARRDEEARHFISPTPLADFMLVGSVLAIAMCGPLIVHAWWKG